MTILTTILLKVKLPDIDIIFILRLLLCIGFGFVLYIPVISMIIDVFICTEEVKGVVFFDKDCNAECWDSSHIGHATMASVALIQIIPVGMYLRVTF